MQPRGIGPATAVDCPPCVFKRSRVFRTTVFAQIPRWHSLSHQVQRWWDDGWRSLFDYRVVSGTEKRETVQDPLPALAR